MSLGSWIQDTPRSGIHKESKNSENTENQNLIGISNFFCVCVCDYTYNNTTATTKKEVHLKKYSAVIFLIYS